MPSQIEKLTAQLERATQKKHEVEREEKRLKKQISEQKRSARTHRLINRGAYLEKLIQEPDLLTDEEVFKLLNYAFSTPFVKDHLEDLLAKKHQEAESAAVTTSAGSEVTPEPG